MKAPESGFALESAPADGGESFQQHGKPAREAVTVSEAAGHRATVASSLEKAGYYGATLEEPLAGGDAKRYIHTAPSTNAF